MATKNFIRTDDRDNIIHGYSDEQEEFQEGDIEVNIGLNPGRAFVLIVALGEEAEPPDGGVVLEIEGVRCVLLTNPSLTNEHGVSLYRRDGAWVRMRTPQEIEADTPEPPELPDPPPTGQQFTDDEAEFLKDFIAGYNESEDV